MRTESALVTLRALGDNRRNRQNLREASAQCAQGSPMRTQYVLRSVG